MQKGSKHSKKSLILLKKSMNKPEVKEKLRQQKLGDKNPAKRPEIRLKIGLSGKGLHLGKTNGNWSGGKIKQHCENCSKEFIAYQRRFCNHDCYREFLVGHKQSEETKIRRGIYNIGENAPAWQGGLSFEPYAKEFNKKLKQLIKQRDNFSCQQCGNNECNLDIHHIDYDKKNNNIKNLISLCKSCHTKTNTQREMWMKHFKSIMEVAN